MNEITVRTNPKFRPWITLFTLSTQLTVIGVGIVAQSAAMQWLGFVFLILIFFALAMQSERGHSGLTIPEARALLDRIEAAERLSSMGASEDD